MTIEEIRAALAAITPGPWDTDATRDVWQEFGEYVAVQGRGIIRAEDAAFIAKAPEIVAWLLSEREDVSTGRVEFLEKGVLRLSEENEKLRAELDAASERERLCIERDRENLYYSAHLADLRKENERLRSGLRTGARCAGCKAQVTGRRTGDWITMDGVYVETITHEKDCEVVG